MKELLQQALDALENFDRFRRMMTDGPDASDKLLAEDYAEIAFVQGAQLITALREALASPMPEPSDMVMVPRDLLLRLIAEAMTFDPALQDGEAITQAKQLAAAPAPAVREPQDERIRWRDAVIKEAEGALRVADKEFADMPTWANAGHAAKKVSHALAVIAAHGIGGGK